MNCTRERLKKLYQKGESYQFVVTDQRNAVGHQIVEDLNCIRHLLTGTRDTYPIWGKLKLVVIGYRAEIKDVYFCEYCAKKIFVPKEHKRSPRLIYTPMGNKR